MITFTREMPHTPDTQFAANWTAKTSSIYHSTLLRRPPRVPRRQQRLEPLNEEGDLVPRGVPPRAHDTEHLRVGQHHPVERAVLTVPPRVVAVHGRAEVAHGGVVGGVGGDQVEDGVVH